MSNCTALEDGDWDLNQAVIKWEEWRIILFKLSKMTFESQKTLKHIPLLQHINVMSCFSVVTWQFQSITHFILIVINKHI